MDDKLMTISRLPDDLILRRAELDDVPFCAQAVALVSEGILDAALGQLRETLGFASLAEMLEAVLYESSSDVFSLENMVAADAEGKACGLLFIYDPKNVSEALPDFVQPLIAPAEHTILDLLSGTYAAGSLSQERLLYVNTLYVDEKLRGQHVGSLLIEAALNLACDGGFDGIFLHCFKSNAQALAFYRSLGFSKACSISYPKPFDKLHPEGGLMLRLSTQKLQDKDALGQGGSHAD